MKLTIQQAIIITGYTNILACPFYLFHEDVEKRLDRNVFTHEFANPIFVDKVKRLYEKDFISICFIEEDAN